MQFGKIFSISDFPVDELNISNQSFITFSLPILVKMMDPADAVNHVGVELDSRALFICYTICILSF